MSNEEMQGARKILCAASVWHLLVKATQDSKRSKIQAKCQTPNASLSVDTVQESPPNVETYSSTLTLRVACFYPLPCS